MASFTGNSIKDVYKDILHTSNSNTGIGSTIKQITCGDGDTTALHLSDRNLKVQPSTDSTTNTVIYDASGNALLAVDSTNDLVKAGIGQHTVNTQYAHFGFNAMDTNLGAGLSTLMSANTHYAIPFTNSGGFGASQVAIGTGTNPDTSFTIGGTGVEDDASNLVLMYFYLCDNITIDRVIWFAGNQDNTGDTARCHLMSYDVDTGNGSTGGDLSNGSVIADGADIVCGDDSQIYYQQMTIQSADVNAGKVLLFTWRQDSVNGDFSIKATIKYHLR